MNAKFAIKCLVTAAAAILASEFGGVLPPVIDFGGFPVRKYVAGGVGAGLALTFLGGKSAPAAG